ncbi:helix-turn-helix transcriptional regulator [Sporosarcina siberiensis]|uniref:Helix-turn-helix transcriptional regulator n=1 Tax=Sporosarcina siberiensis TaxID=1365606 RepID=A0ABW4SE97_9BACL
MIANNIKKMRQSKHITQAEMANQIGIGRTALSKIENGVYYPSATTMKKISDYLNEPLGDVFFNSDVLRNDTKEFSE